MWNRIKALFGGTGDGDGAVTKQQLDAQLEQAISQIQAGDPVAGVKSMEDSVRALQQSAPNSPILGHACYNAAVSNLVAGDGSRAVQLLRQAAAIPGVDRESRKDRLTYLMNLGDILTSMGQLEEAERHLRTGLEERLTFYGQDHPGVAFGLSPLAANLMAQRRAGEALPLIERAAEINGRAGQPEVAGDLALRAYIVKAADQHAEGLSSWGNWPLELQSAVTQAIVQRAQNAESPADAERAILVLDELGERFDDRLPLTERLNTLVMTCNVARLAGAHERRIRAGRRALELAQQTQDPAVVVNIHEGLGMALDDAGDCEQAEQAYQQAYQVAQQADDATLMANVLRNFGLWHSEHENFEQAGVLLKQAVDTARAQPDAEIHGRSLAAYGIFLQHRQQLEPAQQWLEQAVAALPIAHPDRFCAMSHLVAMQQGLPCPCNGDSHQQAASRILEEIVRRSAPAGLLESVRLGGADDNEGIHVQLKRQPTPSEMEQLNRVIELAMAQLRQGATPGAFPK